LGKKRNTEPTASKKVFCISKVLFVVQRLFYKLLAFDRASSLNLIQIREICGVKCFLTCKSIDLPNKQEREENVGKGYSNLSPRKDPRLG
jgi:hypothetical protein